MYIYTVTIAPLYICTIIDKLMWKFFMSYHVNFITFLYFRSIDTIALNGGVGCGIFWTDESNRNGEYSLSPTIN